MAFWTAFLIGFLGSLHCLGMCGPIALALPFQGTSKIRSVLNLLLYNSGRTISYAIIGIIPGILGLGIQLAGFQKYFSIGFGILFLLAALLSINLERKITTLKPIQFITGKVQSGMAVLLKKRGAASMMGIGLANGFLPCGLVYVALAGALAASSITGSMLYIVFFGLGTFPMMFVISSAGSLISLKLRNRLKKITPLFLFLFGLLFLLRGLNVDLPMDLENWLFMGGEVEMCE